MKRNDIHPNARLAAALRQRVVWSEGMFLQPHHFQQMERYLEHVIQTRCQPLQAYHWGWSALEIDRPALAMGKIGIRSAGGILPDGTPFIFDADSAPAMLDIAPQTQDELIVLALPLYRPGSEEFSWRADAAADPGESARSAAWTRYDIAEFEIDDAGTDAYGPAVVQVGRLDVRLLPASALSGDWQAIGAVRVAERRHDGHVVLDEDYIPPMLAAASHPVLKGYVEELHGLLQQRGDALAERIDQPGGGGVGDVADFLLLETVNRYTAVTWHARRSPSLHPEQLYADLLKLACDLATYSERGRRPVAYPDYLHDDLRASFLPLMTQLRRALSIVLEQHAIAIPLQERGHGVRVGQIPSVDLLQQAGFVLAVNADMPADVLRTRFPAQLKMGPVERIRDLVLLQLPGIGLRLLPVAPRQLPYHAGFTYFELEKTGEFWKQLEKSGGLALHVAGDFPGLLLEFWAIRG